MSPAPPPPVPLTDLRPMPVSGHLTRVKRESGDRWRVKWRDAAGVEHKKVLGRVWTGKGRPRAGYLTKSEAQRMLDELLVRHARSGPALAAQTAAVSRSPMPPRNGCATSSSIASGARTRCATTARPSTRYCCRPSANCR